jgi:glycine/D-amino acid oxidase-like deaminating enzyme
VLPASKAAFPESAKPISLEQVQLLEPELRFTSFAAFVPERSVDPRALVSAALKAALHRGVDISSGSEVKALLTHGDRVSGVQTDKTIYSGAIVVNCAGAWAGCIAPHKFPVRPVKGQMVALVGGPKLQHVIRGDEVYLVPRSDGRIVIGSTLEDAGYNKQTEVNTIQRLLHGARELVPALANARVHEDWAGLRPGTPDNLPILGETSTRGYFIASGHYRDGILLAPITAQVMANLIVGKPSTHDLGPFSPARFD